MTALDEKPAVGRPARRLRLVFLLPLGLFLAMALIFLVRLQSGGDLEAVPSALIGQPAPEFTLPALAGSGVPGLSRADLTGPVTLVNIFASWCGPCRLEHPLLAALAGDRRIRVVGINYKDQPDNAGRFLTELGNPYAAIGVDERGRTAIDWGVYGVPETFVIGRDGVIRYKFIGPLTEQAVEAIIRPEIEKALAEG